MRQTWSLHQNWYFTAKDITDDIAKLGPKEAPDIWEEVSVPHTFRTEPYVHEGIKTAQGVGTYYKSFLLEDSLKEKNLYMTFEAVMGVTTIWLNGIHIHTNYGGYLPFVVCLNSSAYFDGRENVLLIRTNNLDNEQVPPGKPQELLDFTYFGGIYRNVWLKAVDCVFITDPLYENIENGGGIMLEYPCVTKEKAVAAIKTSLRSTDIEEKQVILVQEIIDSDGKCVAYDEKEIQIMPGTQTEVFVEITINNPKLWSLNSPSLYQLVTAVVDDNIKLDQEITKFGIRQIEVDREKGILINGEIQPLLSGVNRHQDYPIIGNAAPSSLQKRDAILFKKAGFQVVRAAHYPMAEDFLEACDELGLLLFDATPGWQWYPTAQPEPFSSRVRENIRKMVRRDRNHPCILAYETVLNETYHVPDGFTRQSALTALAEQKSAKVASESYGYDADDNANGIDRESHFMYGFEGPLEKSEKAVMFLREYADCWMESFAEFESRRVSRGRTNGFYPYGEARNIKKANQMLWQNLEEEYSLAKCYALRTENPAFTGCAIWTGIDSRGAKSEIGPCGILDAFRLPKIAYWAFASQQDENKILYLASEWTNKAPIMDQTEGVRLFGTDDYREIFVYSNVKEVELTVEYDNKIIWKERKKPYIDGQAEFLPHPPFLFTKVPYTKGSLLRASGYDEAAKKVIEDVRQTAGVPKRIRLRAEFLGILMQADGNDMVLLHAEIVDDNGTICTAAEHRVYFKTDGDIRIVGEHRLLADTNPARAEAGIASAYLQAGTTTGKVSVSAFAKGLGSDKIEITLIDPKYPDIISSACKTEKIDLQGPENLSAHAMEGDAYHVSMAESEGEWYPDSICLCGAAVFKLCGETQLRMSCKILSGDPNAEILCYLDDVLRWKKKADQAECFDTQTVGADTLKLVIQASQKTEILLRSPWLIKCKVEETAELMENIALGAKATATVNSENADKVFFGGTWIGGRTTEGPQEWEADLGKHFDVQNVKIYVGGQMGSDCTLYKYEVYTSSDAIHWNKQAENNRTSWSNGVLDYFTSKGIRYVKVVFVNVDGKLSAGIQKFELYKLKQE